MSETTTIDAIAGKLDELLAIKRREPARFLDVQSAASYCSLSPESIRRLLSMGKLTGLRPLKGRVLIDRHELDSLIASSTQRPRTGRGRR